MATLLVDRVFGALTRDRTTKPPNRLWHSPSSFISTAQEVINENTTVGFSAVWRALELLSGVMSRMPKWVFEETDEANKKRITGTPLSIALRRRVSVEQTSAKWFENTTMLTLLWGQSFSEIAMGPGRIELYPLHPSRTKAVRDQRTGILGYEYTSEAGGIKRFEAKDILHITMPGFDGITGLGLMSLAKQSIGLALALNKYGGALFGNNAIPGLVLEHPGELGEEGQKHLRRSLEERHRGAAKAWTPLILEEGMTAKTNTPPNDSMQFNETRGMQVLELARYTGISPHLLYWLDRATFSNIEHMGIEFVRYTISNWITRFTSEMEVKLIPDGSSQQIEIDTSELERGDSQTFSKVLEGQIDKGIITFNEARRSLGRNTIGPEGDIRVVNKAMMKAERLEDEPQAAPAFGEPANEPEPDAEPDTKKTSFINEEDDDEQERARRAAAIVLRESMESLIGIECDRVARVVKKGSAAGDAAERITKFYEGFAERVAVAFTPAFASHAAFTGSDMGDVVGMAEEYASSQRDTLLLVIEKGQAPACVLDEWRDSRADQVTDMFFGGSDDGA